MDKQIISVYRDILTVCYAEGLIGKRMFAVDGCKISSNCAKEWRGTKKELLKKCEKIEQSMRLLVKRHREQDEAAAGPGQREKEKRAIKNLKAKAKKIRDWLEENEEKNGAGGRPIKSNITDNESAKMPSSHGVIRGYNGIATVDEKCQVIVDAQAFGDGHEAKNLETVVESVRRTFRALDRKRDVYREVVLTADSGFHSEESVKKLLEGGVDGYLADNGFRQRDPRFAEQQKHKRKTIDRKRTSRARKYFSADDFCFDEARPQFRLFWAGRVASYSRNTGFFRPDYADIRVNTYSCEYLESNPASETGLACLLIRKKKNKNKA